MIIWSVRFVTGGHCALYSTYATDDVQSLILSKPGDPSLNFLQKVTYTILFFNFIFTIFSVIFFTFFRVVSKHDFLFAYFNPDYCYHYYHYRDISLIHYHNYCIIIILLYYHYHIIIVMINYSCIIVSILYYYYYYYHYYHYYYYCYYYYYWCVITLLISSKLLFIIVTIAKIAIIIFNFYHLYKSNLGGEL